MLLKDENFKEINEQLWNGKLVMASNDTRIKMLKQIKCDSEFLCRNGIMDYSLLIVGESNKDNLIKAKHEQGKRNQFFSPDERVIYHIGIIDFLQGWTFDKKVEANSKMIFKCKNPTKISAVEPNAYSKRYIRFMEEHVFPANYVTANSFVQEIKF